MLTCMTCSKQHSNGSQRKQEEEDEAGTPRTKQPIKKLTSQIKDMAIKASGAYKNCKPCSKSSSYNRNGSCAESDIASNSVRSYCSSSLVGSSISKPELWRKETKGISSGKGTSSSLSGGRGAPNSVVFTEEDESKEWVAQVEPGVLITFASMPHGGNDLKRIRFSRELYNKLQAQTWWAQNFDKVMELYNVQKFNQQAIPLSTLSRSEDEGLKIESRKDSPETPLLTRERLPQNAHRCYDSSSGLNSTPKLSGISGANGKISSVDGSVRSSFSRDEDCSEELSEGNASDLETEWVEQDEPGVYVTIRALPTGARELRRVRFSRERFGEKDARLWWEENRARIQEQYLS